MEDIVPSNVSLNSLELGSHLCSIYKTAEEQFSALVSFFKKGIEKNEKCVYIMDENPKNKVISEFEKKGIEIRKLMRSNKFVFLTAKATYLKGGSFDPDKMVDSLRETEKKAIEEGYSGVRGTAEMTWVVKDDKGRKKLVEYETKLNKYYPDNKITSICQYNENRFHPALLVEIIHTHPYIFFYGELYRNDFYYNPTLFSNDEKQLLPPTAYEFIKKDIIEEK